MLIEFTIRNFMSYRDEVSLSMVASTTVKECESNDGYSNVSIMDNGKRYLRSAAIYGANGSGKSSVIAAMDIFKSMVLRSFVDESIVKRLSLLHYRFDVESTKEPISMQMIFTLTVICRVCTTSGAPLCAGRRRPVRFCAPESFCGRRAIPHMQRQKRQRHVPSRC
mgnify:CR=1 FL=1